jgi:glycine betaine/proline transport system ATP-binding protein
MQQRVGLARALASNSDIMLMDEAFSALDPLIRTDMQDLLLELQRDLRKTIIFVTHDLDEALKLADYLTILKDGYVVQKGNPQDIILNPSDRYIEDFVQDINRLRVLRASSVMQPLDGSETDDMPAIEQDETLETALARSGGDTEVTYVVTEHGNPVGKLDMKHLFKALVPRVAKL